MVAAALVSPARAADPAPWLDYRAPPDCASREEFVARVRARMPLVLEAHPADLRVRITREGTETIGRVEIERAGVVGAREVRATSCAEAADALSIMVVLLLDPHAADGAPSVASALPGAPPPPPAPAGTPVTEGARAPPSPAAPGAEASASPPAPGSSVLSRRMGLDRGGDARATGSAPPAVAWELVAEGGLGFGVAPVVSPSGMVGVGVLRGESPLHLHVRVALLLASSNSDLDGGTGRMQLTLAAGQTEVCPTRARWGGTEASPCVLVQAGALRGVGLGLPDAAVATRPWLAPGLSLHGRQWLGQAFLEISASLTAPLLRGEFGTPTRVAYTVPSAAGLTLVGAGVTFR
jgi:hypothetical protein